MKKKLFVSLFAAGIIFIFAGFAFALTDIISYPKPYFAEPVHWQNQYRWYNQDWGWQQNVISGSFSRATLSISAYDVDADYSADPEVDKIYARNNNNNKILLGTLAGSNNIWDYTTFTLPINQFGTTLKNGLQVWIDIDSTHNSIFWAVSLAKSVLLLDGGTLPEPDPGQVPESSILLLLGFGLVGVIGFDRFKKWLLLGFRR